MADVITRLKLESTQFDSKLRDASKELAGIAKDAMQAGIAFTGFSKEQVEAARALGNVASGATNTKDKLRDLVGAYNDVARAYDKLDGQLKEGNMGNAMAESMRTLQGRIAETKKELYGAGDSSKQFGNILDTVGNKLGVTGSLTEMLTSKTALLTAGIGASVVAVMKATEAWAAYNAELAKQDQITTVTTGLKGDDANRMTDAARALATVYNVDFREAINAANTLMTQFGASGDDAIKLLRDGMQGMIAGDGGKLLSMIQQFAPAFRDAGVSASQLVAVIQNSEGGIFTDQNMQAIVMGVRNIRLMKDTTSAALAQIGIDGQRMSQQLNEGTMTVFEALKLVAQQIKTVDSNSKASGEVMQAVFGRQGVTAGTNLGKAIETLNTNLEETKLQTGEVGQATAELQVATEKLNTAIRECFEYDGWDVMTTSLKTGLIAALATLIETIGTVKTWLTDVEVAGVNLFDGLRTAALNSLGPLGQVLNMLININAQRASARGLESGPAHGALLSAWGDLGNGGGNARTTYPRDAVIPNLRNQLESMNKKGIGTKLVDGGIKNVNAMQGTGTRAVHESMAELKSMLSQAQAEIMKATDFSTLTQATNQVKEIREKIEAQPMALRLGISTEEMVNLKKEILKGLDDIPPVKIEAVPKKKEGSTAEEKAAGFGKAAKTVSFISGQMSNLTGGINSIVSGIEGLGIEVSEDFKKAIGVFQSIFSIISGISAILSVIESVMMIKTILPFLANGGVVRAASGYVPGNYMSGDQVPALLNSGELVLNKAQVGNLAASLSDRSNDFVAETYISGEQLRIVLNRNGRRTGKGEYVQTRKAYY